MYCRQPFFNESVHLEQCSYTDTVQHASMLQRHDVNLENVLELSRNRFPYRGNKLPLSALIELTRTTIIHEPLYFPSIVF